MVKFVTCASCTWIHIKHVFDYREKSVIQTRSGRLFDKNESKIANCKLQKISAKLMHYITKLHFQVTHILPLLIGFSHILQS